MATNDQTHDTKASPEHLNGDLPSIAEINTSTELLSPPEVSTRVVRVRNYAVKYGTSLSLLEAENMKYVSEKCSLPFVPKVYGTLSEPSSNRKFIIMEYIEGQTLDKLWSSLDDAEKAEVCYQMKEALTQLRNLPSPGYIGSLDRKHSADVIFWTPPPIDPSISGPFDSEEGMNEGMLRRLAETESGLYVDFLRTMVKATLHGHGICFAHGDLQAKNVMVQRKAVSEVSAESSEHSTGTETPKGQGEKEKVELEVKIIDWEYSGWYPEYWEFCSATFIARYRPEWLRVVNEVLDVFPQEYLMMQVVRDHILV